LKVLKAKTTSGNSVYAPKAGASSVKDAALKILGNNCTSQCSWHVLQSQGFELQALCPTPEAASAKISNIGQFLSVDFRPMETSRGTMKQIVSLFKENLRNSNVGLDSVKDPFLCLNIICPKGSYDPNVEPSKNDVLFDDSSKVIAAVTELFTAIYPVQGRGKTEETTPPTVSSVDVIANVEITSPLQSFQRRQVTEAVTPPARKMHTTIEEDFGDDVVLGDEELNFLEQCTRTPAWRSNMYGCDEEDLELLVDIDDRPAVSVSQEIEDDPREAAREVNLWTIAQMNAPVRRTTNNDSGPFRPPREEVENILNTPITLTHHDTDYPHITQANSWTAINYHQVNDRNSFPATAARQSQIAAFCLPTPHPSSSPAFGTPLVAIPEMATRARPTRLKANVNKPFVSPLNDNPANEWSRDFGPPSWPKKRPKAQDLNNKDIRDAFGGTVARRSPQEPPLVTQGESVDQNSQILQSDNVKPPPAKCPQRTEGGKRSKSSRLPLQRVPENQQMHQLGLTTRISLRDITTDLAQLKRFGIMGNCVPWESGAEGVYDTFQDGVNRKMVQVWSQRIKGLLEKQLERLESDNKGKKSLACVGALSRLDRIVKGIGVVDVL
jgi:hypothetical protein